MGALRGLWRSLAAAPPVAPLRAELDARRRAAAIRPEGPSPLLVYQMGKVGSSSVLRTLESLDLPRPVLHFHYLTPGFLARARRHGTAPDQRLGAAVARRLRRAGPGLRCEVVTLVRDPIARRISALFQNPEHAGGAVQDAQGRIDPERAAAWLRRSVTETDAVAYAEKWLDGELFAVFGIDVFAHPFDRARGWEILRGERADVLVLRCEDLDRTLGPALRSFLGLPREPAVVRDNVRAAGPDAAAYAAVRRLLRLDRATCERIYAGRLARHFYPPEQLERFTRRWTGETDAAPAASLG